MGKPSLVWTQLQASKQAGRLGGASKMCTLSIDSVHSSTRASTGVHQPPPRPPCTPLARSPPRGRARGEAVVRHVMLGHLEPLQRSQADLSPQRRLGVVRTSLRRHPVLPPSAPGDGSLGEGGGEGGREEGGKRREEREQEEKENEEKKKEGEKGMMRGREKEGGRGGGRATALPLEVFSPSKTLPSTFFRHMHATWPPPPTELLPFFLNKHLASSKTIFPYR